MTPQLILASGSTIRAQMLRQAGLDIQVVPPRVDEDALKASLLQDGISLRDMADELGAFKAAKVAGKHPDALVLGCDQVLDFEGALISKPQDPQDAIDQLMQLSGKLHKLHSSAVLYHEGRPIWRHIGTAMLVMRTLSDGFVADYVDRNWDSIRHSVGGYKIEEEGVRLFTSIQGDTFTIQGLPLLALLSYLIQRGTLDI